MGTLFLMLFFSVFLLCTATGNGVVAVKNAVTTAVATFTPGPLYFHPVFSGKDVAYQSNTCLSHENACGFGCCPEGSTCYNNGQGCCPDGAACTKSHNKAIPCVASAASQCGVSPEPRSCCPASAPLCMYAHNFGRGCFANPISPKTTHTSDKELMARATTDEGHPTAAPLIFHPVVHIGNTTEIINTCIGNESKCQNGCCPAGTYCFTQGEVPGCCPNGTDCHIPDAAHYCAHAVDPACTTADPTCCPSSAPTCAAAVGFGTGCMALPTMTTTINIAAMTSIDRPVPRTVALTPREAVAAVLSPTPSTTSPTVTSMAATARTGHWTTLTTYSNGLVLIATISDTTVTVYPSTSSSHPSRSVVVRTSTILVQPTTLTVTATKASLVPTTLTSTEVVTAVGTESAAGGNMSSSSAPTSVAVTLATKPSEANRVGAGVGALLLLVLGLSSLVL
ncbi:hypothetical protein NA57DRAFT_57874 [Rhizodiscina lignyota]|uniref:Uncharacterized protein n=1 Tax=Rhizodiscina lignyota TaxID=1504668 RepID=A0A9P4I936_9PEZI|nr:hypothetical protein NA57DRAFT_57874 [Rhizodiscina lignyota]